MLIRYKARMVHNWWTGVSAKQFTLLLLMVACSLPSLAQQRVVSGKITDAATQQPMPGVNVVLKGTTSGTTTDSEGVYSLSVSGSEPVLIFSFIGFATQDAAVGGRTSIDVAMVEDAESLGEVVVTAFGIERETKTLVYSTQLVKPETLIEVRDANNVLNSLQGKVANVVVSQGSGGPGSGARVVLRGNRFIQGTNNALIVVDGIPLLNPTFSAAANDFGSIQSSDGASNINSDDIESLSVISGSAASTLYGSQGANGVILISTKKAKKNGVSVVLNTGVTSETPFSLPKFQNSFGQGLGGVLNPSVGDSWGAALNGQSYTNYLGEQRNYTSQPDNVSDFFRTGISVNNSLGVSVGSEKVQTYFSYARNQVQGIIPRNDLDRHNFNVRMSSQVSDRLSIDAKVNYIFQDINNKPRTGEENAPVIDIYQIPRNVSLDDAKRYETINSVGIPEPTAWPATDNAIYQNPYWLLNRTSINESRNRAIGFLAVKYKITDWLNVQGRAGIDRIADQVDESYSQGTKLYVNNSGGFFAKQYNTSTQKWFDVILEGSNKLSSDFQLSYKIGAVYQDIINSIDRVQSNGLNVVNKFSLNFMTNPTPSSNFVQSRLNAGFTQASLGYKDALFFEGTYRIDWSSTLPSPYNFSYYSVGVSAVLSELMTLPEPISFLKVNSNYARTGSGGAPQARFNVYNFQQGAGNGFVSRGTTEAITNLKPELATTFEVGFESRFLKDRLGVNLTYYTTDSENQLLVLPQAVATGFANKFINAGLIRNNGIELVVFGTPVKSGKFSWDVSYNLGINRNKIVELSPELNEVTLRNNAPERVADPVVKVGGSYGDIKGYSWERKDGRYVVTADGTPVRSSQRSILGNFNPKATMGITNTFTFGSLSLRVLIDGRIGGEMISGTESNLAFSGITEETTKFRGGGLNLGGVNSTGAAVDKAITAQQFWQTATGKRDNIAEFFIYDATSFRVRELAIGYDIPVPGNFFIKSARISIVGRNLFWLYRGESKLDIPGIGKRTMWFDPDMTLGNGNYQGVEYGAMPSTRSVGFNLNLVF